MKTSCSNYCGIECINGLCPWVLYEDYPWRERPTFNCDKCPYNHGCKSCIGCNTRTSQIEE